MSNITFSEQSTHSHNGWLQRLPEELLEHIFSFLVQEDPLAIPTLGLCSRRLYVLCNYERQWKSIHQLLVNRHKLRDTSNLCNGKFPLDHTLKQRTIRILCAVVLKTCSFCHHETNCIFIDSWNLRICNSCACEHVLSRAQMNTEFGLNPRNLKRKNLTQHISPQHSSHGVFYLREQVEQAAIEYWGSASAVKKNVNKRHLRSVQRAKKKREHELKRAGLVVHACDERNVNYSAWCHCSNSSFLTSLVSSIPSSVSTQGFNTTTTPSSSSSSSSSPTNDWLQVHTPSSMDKKEKVRMPSKLDRAHWQIESFVAKGVTEDILLQRRQSRELLHVILSHTHSTTYNNNMGLDANTSTTATTTQQPHLLASQIPPSSSTTTTSANELEMDMETEADCEVTDEDMANELATEVVRGVECTQRFHYLTLLWKRSSLPQWWLKKKGFASAICMLYPQLSHFVTAVDVNAVSLYDDMRTQQQCIAMIQSLVQLEQQRSRKLCAIFTAVQKACANANINFNEVTSSPSFHLVCSNPQPPEADLASSLVMLPFTWSHSPAAKATLVAQRIKQLDEYCAKRGTAPMSRLEIEFHQRWTRPRTGICATFCEFLNGKTPISTADGLLWDKYNNSVQRHRLVSLLNGCAAAGFSLTKVLERDTAGVAKMYLSRYLSLRMIGNTPYCPFQHLDSDDCNDDDNNSNDNDNNSREIDDEHEQREGGEPPLKKSKRQRKRNSLDAICPVLARGKHCECALNALDAYVNALTNWNNFISSVETYFPYNRLTSFKAKHLYRSSAAMHFSKLPQKDFVDLPSILCMKFKGFFNVNLSVTPFHFHANHEEVQCVDGSSCEDMDAFVIQTALALKEAEDKSKSRLAKILTLLQHHRIPLPQRIEAIDPYNCQGMSMSEEVRVLSGYVHLQTDISEDDLNLFVSQWKGKRQQRMRRKKEAVRVAHEFNVRNLSPIVKKHVDMFEKDGDEDHLRVIARECNIVSQRSAARSLLRRRKRQVQQTLGKMKAWESLSSVEKRFCLGATSSYSQFCNNVVSDDVEVVPTTNTTESESESEFEAQPHFHDDESSKLHLEVALEKPSLPSSSSSSSLIKKKSQRDMPARRLSRCATASTNLYMKMNNDNIVGVETVVADVKKTMRQMKQSDRSIVKFFVRRNSMVM